MRSYLWLLGSLMISEWHRLQQFHSNSLKSLRVKHSASLTWHVIGTSVSPWLCLYIIQRALELMECQEPAGKATVACLSHLGLQHTEVCSNSESSLVLPMWICRNYPGAQGSFKILLLKRNDICHSCQCNIALQRDKFYRFFSEKLSIQGMHECQALPQTSL